MAVQPTSEEMNDSPMVPPSLDPRHLLIELVSEVVTFDVTTLARSAGIDTAVRTMREKGVRRLPIVNEEGLLTGIVTADGRRVAIVGPHRIHPPEVLEVGR